MSGLFGCSDTKHKKIGTPAEKYALTVKVKYYMYQLCSDLQVFIKCSSAQTVADGGLVSGGPWKVEAPRASASLVAGGVDRRSE